MRRVKRHEIPFLYSRKHRISRMHEELLGARVPFLPAKEKTGGRQTIVTESVSRFAAKHPKKSTWALRKAAEEILGFPKAYIQSREIAARVYGQRTAEDIFATGTLTAFKFFEKGKGTAKIASTGCAEQCIAFSAFLRAKRIAHRFVRAGTHSFVKFWLGKKAYWANFDGENLEFGRYAEPKWVKAAKRHGDYAEGKDQWDIGMLSFMDFEKYAKKTDY